MILFHLACIADDPIPGGQSGEEDYGCAPLATTAIGLDETTEFGVTASELVALADGDHSDTFAWASGTTTPLTLGVVVDTDSIVWVDYEFDDGGSGIEIAMDCTDTVEMDATLAVATEDGAFAESFTLRIAAIAADTLTWSTQQTLDEVAGSYDAADVDTSSYNDGVFLNWNGSFTSGAVSGVVEGQGTGHSGAGEDGTAFAEMFAIGSYGAQPADE